MFVVAGVAVVGIVGVIAGSSDDDSSSGGGGSSGPSESDKKRHKIEEQKAIVEQREKEYQKLYDELHKDFAKDLAGLLEEPAVHDTFANPEHIKEDFVSRYKKGEPPAQILSSLPDSVKQHMQAKLEADISQDEQALQELEKALQRVQNMTLTKG